FHATVTSPLSTLSLHDALPISLDGFGVLHPGFFAHERTIAGPEQPIMVDLGAQSLRAFACVAAQPVGAGELHPGPPFFYRAHHCLETFPAHTFYRIGTADVIDHDLHARA